MRVLPCRLVICWQDGRIGIKVAYESPELVAMRMAALPSSFN